MSLVWKSSSRGSKFERPEEVVCLLEVRSNSVDFVDKIFNVVDSDLSERFSYNSVAWKRNSLFVDFAVSSLQNELSDGFSGRIPEGHVRLNLSEKVWWSFIDSDESSVMDLSQSEQSQDSDDFRVEFVNTSDSHNERKFWLCRYIDLSGKFGLDIGISTFLLASISALTAFWWLASCYWALFKARALWALLAYLLLALNSCRAFAYLASLYSFFLCASGLGGTTFSPAIFTTIWLIIE